MIRLWGLPLLHIGGFELSRATSVLVVHYVKPHGKATREREKCRSDQIFLLADVTMSDVGGGSLRTAALVRALKSALLSCPGKVAHITHCCVAAQIKKYGHEAGEKIAHMDPNMIQDQLKSHVSPHQHITVSLLQPWPAIIYTPFHPIVS